ncbi:MAG: hypothetical protein H5T59_09100 [Anaerolineae bacterium]|nr:hypothetical protein [Anaerolineae bacterium]
MSQRQPYLWTAHVRRPEALLSLLGLAAFCSWCAGDPAEAAAWFQSPASPLRPAAPASPAGLLMVPPRAVAASFWAAALALVAVLGIAVLLRWFWLPPGEEERDAGGP